MNRLAHHHPGSLVLVCLVLGLAACGRLASPSAAVLNTVEFEGRSYRVEQITASTWTAAAAALPTGQTASLAKAIEKASGCQVTDSNLTQGGSVLSAQVDCASKIKY